MIPENPSRANVPREDSTWLRSRQGLSLAGHEPWLATTQKPLLLPTSGPITDASLTLPMPMAV